VTVNVYVDGQNDVHEEKDILCIAWRLLECFHAKL
jgi:hypothetical protein